MFRVCRIYRIKSKYLGGEQTSEKTLMEMLVVNQFTTTPLSSSILF